MPIWEKKRQRILKNKIPQWLEWARKIQAISQNGLAYAHNEYEKQRHEQLLAIAAEIIADHTKFSKVEIVENYFHQTGYATPKIDVRGAVIRDGKILLVKERSDGLWCMPGGWADVGETPAQSVAREVWEESGFTVKPEKVIAVHDANRTGTPLELYHAYKIIFLCSLSGGQAQQSIETSAVDFFSFDRLPPLSRNRTNEHHLKEVFAHTTQKDRPTAFD